MNQNIYQVDAFANRVFEGNPAAVLLLTAPMAEDLMQNIAEENNLSETAFAVLKQPNHYDLRWFTPNGEVDLCGHATLATAHILFTKGEISSDQITFYTKSGELQVRQLHEGKYLLDFPADDPLPAADFDTENTLGIVAPRVFVGKDDYLIILDSEEAVKNCSPNFEALTRLDKRGVIISAKGTNHDFVSRCFYPKYGINEDPVTGSAHTLLTCYWAIELKKNRLNARQLSKRGGNLECILKGKRVALIGSAATYLQGEIML